MLCGNGMLLLFGLYILSVGKRKGYAEIEWVRRLMGRLDTDKNGNALAESAERDSYNVLPLPNPVFLFQIHPP